MTEPVDHLAAGDHLIQRYYERGDIGEVERAVAQYRLALAGISDTKTGTGILAQLGVADAVRIQFDEGTASEQECRDVLSVAEEALSNTESLPVLRLHALDTLGQLHHRLFHYNKSPESLQKGTDTFRDLVDLATDLGSPVLVKALAFYALMVSCHYDKYGDADSIYEANSIIDRALDLIPKSDRATDPSLTEAFSRVRYLRSILAADEDDLRDAIEALQDFVWNTHSTYPDIHFFWASLGFYHRRRWLLKARDADLDAGIVAYDEARKRVADHHPLWHVRYGNYASALHRRYRARSNLEDLDEAVKMAGVVVEHMDRMKRLGRKLAGQDVYVQNLANFLEDSYSEYGKVELLDEAISVHLGNLPNTPNIRKSDALTSLARAYITRFTRQGRSSDLEGAISLLEQALEEAIPGRVRISASNYLSTALLARYDEYGEFSDLERAIAVLRRTDPVLNAHEAQGVHHSLLGVALHRCFLKTSRRQDIEESIRSQQIALQYFPEGTSMAVTVLVRLGEAQFRLFVDSRDMAAGHDSIETFHRALSLTSLEHPDRTKHLVHSGRAQLAVAEARPGGDVSDAVASFCAGANYIHGWASDRYVAASEWAKVQHSQGSLSYALEAYRLAISFLPEMASFGLEHELRMLSLSKQAPDLCQNAAACAIELGQLEVAVELLEAGKSVVWTMGQELRTDLSRLEEVAPGLATELAETNSALEYRQPWGQDMKDADREFERRRLHRLASRRADLIELVRQVSGFENFLLPTSFLQLSEAAVGGPVVILNSSIYRSDAVLVQDQYPPILVPLPALQHDQARQDARTMSALSQVPKDKRGIIYAESILTMLLRRLWETVGSPVCVALASQSVRSGRMPRVWWCPSGPMSFLPIHACGPLDGLQSDLSDLVVSSYTPTLTALMRARSLVPRSQHRSPRMLAIIQPNLIGRLPLPSAMEEMDALRSLPGPTTFLIGPNGTVAAVEKELPVHSWIHVSTHGSQGFFQPMESSIALHDGALTLLQLSKARLPEAEFAFLSACHSARGTEWVADESMHLAAGFLFAGYKSIVATSRAIADRDAPVVAQAFYGYLTRDGKAPDMTEAAEALSFATRALRASGVPALRWAPFIHIGV